MFLAVSGQLSVVILLKKRFFMLRQAQHEPKIIDVFNVSSVRPELVEG